MMGPTDNSKKKLIKSNWKIMWICKFYMKEESDC